MELKKMKTAVIGAGRISDIYLQNLGGRWAIIDLVGVSARHPENARKKAEKYGIRAMTNEEIFADPEIEMVVDLTPAPEHYGIIKATLEAGKHAYTEKIMTLTSAEARDLLALAGEKGLRIGSAPDTFLNATYQAARWAIDSGMIGKVTSVTAVYNRDCSLSYKPGNFEIEPGGGVGVDVGIYYLTALLSIVGPVKRVAGMTKNDTPNRVMTDPASPFYGQSFTVQNENLMNAVLEFENGVYGTLHFDGTTIYPQKSGVTFYGTEGILKVASPDEYDGNTVIWKKGMDTPFTIPSPFGFWDNSRGVGVAEMAWAIRGGRPHRASGDMAAHAVEIFEGIIRSGEEGVFVGIDSSFDLPKAMPQHYVGEMSQFESEDALLV